MTLLAEHIHAEVAKRGSQRAVAKWLNVSPAHVSDMLKGKRGAGPRILARLGLAKVVTHDVTYTRVPHRARAR